MAARAFARAWAVFCIALKAADAYPALGAYVPVTDVHEHAQLSEDIKAFNDAIAGSPPGYEAARNVYMYGGGNSCKEEGKTRKMSAFSLREMVGESFAKAFYDSGLATAFWDDEIQLAFSGTGKYAGLSDTKRQVSLKKLILGLATYYAAHELEAGINQAASDGASDSGSAHTWDEGWAFYYGVDGTNSPWEVAKKRDGNFPDGAQVQTAIVPYFNSGLHAVRAATYNDTAAKEARDVIYKMFTITYLRAAYKYLEISERSYADKPHAEGYAYYMAIDGWIASKAPQAAKAMREALDITKSSIESGTYCTAKSKMEDAYPALGIDCQMMGTWTDPDATLINCPDDCGAPVVQLPDGAEAAAMVVGNNHDKTCTMVIPDDTPNEDQICDMGCHDLEEDTCVEEYTTAEACGDAYGNVKWEAACNCRGVASGSDASSSDRLRLSWTAVIGAALFCYRQLFR